MKKINVAVIGSGFMGAAHIEALRRIPGINVSALSSIDTPRAQELANQFDIPNVYEDWMDVVQDPDIEVVHNCTPNNLHFTINKALLEAGKHVLSEKPLTMTGDEADELMRLAEKHGNVTAINFNYRFYPLIQHAKGLVQTGQIGDVYLVHGHYVQDWLLYDTDYNWRLESKISGASRAVADIGSHWCDLVQFITGHKITRVMADLYTVHETRKRPRHEIETFKGKEEGVEAAYDEVPIDTEDVGIVMMQFDTGARGVMTVSQVSAGRKNHEWFEIDGGRSALSWNQEEPNKLWIGHRDKPNEVLIKDPSLLDPEARTYAHYPGGHPEGYPDGPKNLFRNLYRYIAAGKTPATDPADFPTFADGAWEVKVVEAVLESHRTQAWVEVDGQSR